MAAFTHLETTCSAVNMCCYFSYYMTGMSALLVHSEHAPGPNDRHFHIPVRVHRMWPSNSATSFLHIVTAFRGSQIHKCFSFISHFVLAYFWYRFFSA